MEDGIHDVLRIHERNSTISGVTIPGPKKTTAGFIYGSFVILFNFVTFTLVTIQLLQTRVLINICVDFIGDSTILYGLVMAAFFVKRSKSFFKLLNEIDDLTSSFLSDPLDPERTFYKRMMSDYKYLQIYSKLSVPFLITSAVIFFSVNIVRGLKLFGMDGKKILSVDIWLPDTDRSPNFEIAQFFGATSIITSCGQKQTLDCYILTIMFLLSTCLDHLSMTAKNIFITSFLNDKRIQDKSQKIENFTGAKSFYEETIMFNQDAVTYKNSATSVNREEEDNLKHWIKLHQKTLSICKDLTDLLSPLLAFYLVNITSLVAANVFTVSLGVLVINEMFSLTFYCGTCVLSLYMMCHYGNKIIEKSTHVADAAFWICFQRGGASKTSYNSLKVVFQRTTKPLILSPFSSTAFQLSKNSFVSFSWSIISLYLAIKKMKEANLL